MTLAVQLRAATAAVGLLASLASSSAQAHVCLDVPVSRVGPGCNALSAQKKGPCGVNVRGTNVTTFRPGETISVSLNETVDHPSHYRIAFNPDGDAFEDPTSKDDKTGAHPYVLLDGIADEAAAKQTVKVTLPNVTCDRCTLQLIQVMYDKGGNGFGGNDGVAPDNDDLYYACADIVLEGDPITGDAGSADAGATGSDAGQGRPDAGDSSTPAVHDDAATPEPDPEPVRDAGKGKDASVAEDDSDDEKGDTSPSSSDDGCTLAAARPAAPRAGSWLGLVLLSLLVRRRPRRP